MRMELDRECLPCYGTGVKDVIDGKRIDCHCCDGKGRTPTAEGQQILRFIAEYAPKVSHEP